MNENDMTFEEYEKLKLNDENSKFIFHILSRLALDESILVEKGFITKEEYDKRQEEIMSSLIKMDYDRLSGEDKKRLKFPSMFSDWKKDMNKED